ncbi:peptidyl-prolyl cis-trans isomerase FKBP2-like [Hyposmocoma kahamanoa]|uniref:peptidyl-prolyl cis-trans isomerase FKBP2-like n=1 Tax=Hyposmocoma kahamanoa TaxID=1477025 RepID=UPI000E6D82BA|nr:peptidyl-prolyl cis-trans isomerase FKBP2-like [Hyposmocoma kahamanoa]
MKTAIAIIFMSSLFVLVEVFDSSENFSKPDTFLVLVLHLPHNCRVRTQKGDLIHVHYKGTFEDGTEFDSSYPRNNPLTFRLGSMQVVKGWGQGLLYMCIGEIRKLIIGSDLAYGATGVPPTIPPYTTLYFEIKLVAIERNPELDELNKAVILGPPDPPKKKK